MKVHWRRRRWLDGASDDYRENGSNGAGSIRSSHIVEYIVIHRLHIKAEL